MHDRRNSGKSMILSVIGITVILLGLFLVVAPTFIPNLAYGNNPPNIYYCSVLYHGTYASSITTLSVSANIAPAAGSGISLVTFRYAQSAMTPTQALDPNNNYANARTLQWINVSMVTNQAPNTWIIPNPGFVGPVTPDHPTPAGTIPVSSGYYYYYLVNAYSFDGSSNYFPDQGTNSILNNWFSVGSVSSNPTPTPTPIYTPTTYDVAFTVSSGSGTLSWYDSTTSAQGGAGTYTFAANDALSVTANPAQGYQFDHFYISGTSSGSTTTNPFTMNVASGFAINAYFVQIGATPTPTQPGQTSSPTYNPNPTPTPTLKPNQSPTPTPTYNPNTTPTASPAPYNPFTSPSPAPYTTVRSWVVVVIGVAFMLCGGLMVSIGQTNIRRKP